MKLIDSNREFTLKTFDRVTLEKSFVWLNDPEIQAGMNIKYRITKKKVRRNGILHLNLVQITKFGLLYVMIFLQEQVASEISQKKLGE